MAGRRVLITGGTGSIGRGLVEAFTNSKDLVTFTYMSNKEQSETLKASYGAEAIQVDFMDDIRLPTRDFEIVVNNIGINISRSKVSEVTLKEWSDTLRLNLTVPFLIAQMCIPSMINGGWGRIINISSIYGLRAVEGNLAYTVSKHGLAGVTKTIAKEYGEYGITCNEICPGPVESKMMQRIGKIEAAAEKLTVEEYFESIRSDIPVGRLAEPQDVAACAVFLASPEAGYINGVSIPLDGGLIA